MKFLQKTDSQILDLIKKEEKRQEDTLMMIPSENIASYAVDQAVGSCLGNKYAEGYPYKRYYQGQAVVDEVENLANERAKQLFGVPYANVQPYSGSPANLEVLSALMQPGETMMGLSLAFGGHLTHGASASMTSKFFKSIQYELNKDGYIDYDTLEKIAKEVKPKVIVAGTTAYPRLLDWKRFSEIATSVGAYLMADIAHIAGLIAGEAYPSPIPFADVLTTTTHKTLRGPRGAMIMVTDKGLQKDPDLSKKIAKSVFPGLQGGPHINTIAGIAVALKEASKPEFKTYAQQIVKNAKRLGEELTKHEIRLISGGTDSHLLLADLRNFNVLGNTVAEGLEAVNIIVNFNSVPFDTNPPFYPSGIRLGTPGITSRDMKEEEMKLIATAIVRVIKGLKETKEKMKVTFDMEKKKSIRKEIIDNTPIIEDIKQEILQLCKQFPLRKEY